MTITPGMRGARVIVAPASGRRESLAVLVLVLAILLAAGGVIALQRQTGESVQLPAWQIDLRSGLNAAEQGLTADLLTAAPEIPWLEDTSPGGLAAEGLSPFMRDAASVTRGGHVWHELPGQGDARGWLGLPSVAAGAAMPDDHGHDDANAPDSGPARPILLRLEGEAPTVWLYTAAGQRPDVRTFAGDAALGNAALIAAGWRQVAIRFDASVTRKDAQ